VLWTVDADHADRALKSCFDVEIGAHALLPFLEITRCGALTAQCVAAFDRQRRIISYSGKR
jgi:hypothetical protein